MNGFLSRIEMHQCSVRERLGVEVWVLLGVGPRSIARGGSRAVAAGEERLKIR